MVIKMKNGNNNHKTHKQVRYYLFWLCIAWMITQMVFIAWKFFKLPIPINIPQSFPVYYFIILLTYTVVRSSARWAHKAMPRKKGGIFVFIWGVFTLILHIVAAIGNGYYQIPDITLQNLIFVCSVYVASRIEKRLFLNLRNKS